MNCSYCYLGKSKQDKNYDEKVQNAWKDGTYAKNAIKSINLYNKHAQIEEIQFWGAETTLGLKNIIPNIEYFYDNLPQLHHWFIVTNFIDNIDSLFNFLLEVNKQSSLHNKKSIFCIQASIDGPDGLFENKGHTGSWKIYHKNFDKLADLMQNEDLSNIEEFQLFIKCTVKDNVALDKFLYDKYRKEFENYYKKELSNIRQLFSNINIKSNIFISVTPFIALPYEIGSIPLKLLNYLKDEQYTQKMFKNNKHDYFSHDWLCSSQQNQVPINFDGSIVPCHSDFILADEDYINYLKENDIELYNNYYPIIKRIINPLKVSSEELERFKYFIEHNRCTYSLTSSIELAVIKELVELRQIDKVFNNKKIAYDLAVKNPLMFCLRYNSFYGGLENFPALYMYRSYFNTQSYIAELLDRKYS